MLFTLVSFIDYLVCDWLLFIVLFVCLVDWLLFSLGVCLCVIVLFDLSSIKMFRVYL